LVAALVELAVAHPLALGEKRDTVAVLVCQRARHLWKCAARILGDLADLGDRPEHAGQVGVIARDALEEPHSSPCRHPRLAA
jgi:hypothetical protein